ncbi:hypothetical protein [Arthrobacter sp. B1805]|uniref:hypothetical protein n=1 Tax=Arthrobacter sp. B1805 TaxID=2058892 RepID=UPI000CE442D3|nr:hypothetical protein [Arthrobacter sp. B1805]
MDTQTARIGLMADPGLPEKVAEALTVDLSGQLARDVDTEVRWEVKVSRQTLPLTSDGNISLMEQAERLRSVHEWDYIVYLTDLPRTQAQEPMLCELSSSARAALISLPALGAFRLTSKTCQLLTTVISSLREGSRDFPSLPAARNAVGFGALHRLGPSGPDDISYITRPGRVNRGRLLAGMVRNNRPGRLLSALSSCVAAAAATGAFGIFYTSIWSMADALHPIRLALISLVAITALSGWLILRNGLWTTPRNAAFHGRTSLDNAATVITVGLSVALMYMVLHTLLLFGALAIIDSGYLQTQLGHPVTLVDYARLSWLAASLGITAGALGSNFDSDDAIREATYSRREYQRRQQDGARSA